MSFKKQQKVAEENHHSAILWTLHICVQTEQEELVHWNTQKIMKKDLTFGHHLEGVEGEYHGWNLVVVPLL